MTSMESDASSHRSQSPSNTTVAKKRCWFRRFWSAWWLETVAVISSFGSLLAVVVILHPYRNQPNPTWTFGLTINALVSVLGGVFKSAIFFIVASVLSQFKWHFFRRSAPLRFMDYFDDASRGPLGALQLIFASKPNLRSVVPVTAACTIILSMAIDPFLQQLVKYYPCQHPNPSESASVYTVHSYTPAPLANVGPLPYMPSLGMRASVNMALQGVFNASSTPPPFVCTGNSTCAVDSYWTAAICASCEDVTSHLEISCSHANPFMCTTTLRGNDPSITTRRGSFFQIGTDWKSNDVDTLASFYFIVNQKSTQICSGFWKVHVPLVWGARCSLSPCIQKLQPSHPFNAAIMGEQVIASVRIPAPDRLSPKKAGVIPLSCLEDGQEDLLRSRGLEISHGVARLPQDQTWDSCAWFARNDSLMKQICDKCFFRIDPEATQIIREGFGQYPDNAGKGAFVDFQDTYLCQNRLHSSTTHVREHPKQDSLASVFWRNGAISFESLNNTFNDLARAMSVQMRTDMMPYPGRLKQKPWYDIRGESVQGTAFDSETCVEFVWGWLSLPVALLGLVVALFVTIIIVSVGSANDKWKASSLPLLFHGLDNAGLTQYEGANNDIHCMQDAASKFSVRLETKPDGALFLGASKSNEDSNEESNEKT